MLKQLMISATLLGFGTGPASAQQREAVLERKEVPGADFDIVLAVPKSPSRLTYDLSESPDALVIHLVGGELVLAFEDAAKMLTVAESLRSPVSASHWVSKDGKTRTPFASAISGHSPRPAPSKAAGSDPPESRPGVSSVSFRSHKR